MVYSLLEYAPAQFEPGVTRAIPGGSVDLHGPGILAHFAGCPGQLAGARCLAAAVAARSLRGAGEQG